MGIFKGFVHRAMTICSEKHLDSELEFLVGVFTENGYCKPELRKTINEMKRKRTLQNSTEDNRVEEINVGLVTLPWVPGLSPKLRKQFRKAGVKVVFKSGRNLKSILTTKNKSKLPDHSHPGVYRIPCKKHPENPYIGETKLQIRTRNVAHQEYVRKEKWDQSGVASHSRLCNGVEWEKIETLKVEKHRFDRKVREALEIQYHKCGPEKGGMNLDDGDYVKTKFWTPFMTYLKQKSNVTPDNTVTSDRDAVATSNN